MLEFYFSTVFFPVFFGVLVFFILFFLQEIFYIAQTPLPLENINGPSLKWLLVLIFLESDKLVHRKVQLNYPYAFLRPAKRPSPTHDIPIPQKQNRLISSCVWQVEQIPRILSILQVFCRRLTCAILGTLNFRTGISCQMSYNGIWSKRKTCWNLRVDIFSASLCNCMMSAP